MLLHQVLGVPAHPGHLVLPIVIGLAVLALTWKLIQVRARRRMPSDGQLVEIKLPATVDPKGSAVLRRNLHPLLTAGGGSHNLATP